MEYHKKNATTPVSLTPFELKDNTKNMPTPIKLFGIKLLIFNIISITIMRLKR